MYQYKMVQIAPTVITQGRRTGTGAADYLEQIVNQWAAINGQL